RSSEQTYTIAYVDDLRFRMNSSSLDRRIRIDRLYPSVVGSPDRCAYLSRFAEMRCGSNQPPRVIEPVDGRVDEAVIRIKPVIAVDGAVFAEHPLSSEGDCGLFHLPPLDSVVTRILLAVGVGQYVI